MTIQIKNHQEIEKMRIAGRLAGEVLQMIRPHVQIGVTTDELDRLCHDYIVNEQKAIPAPLITMDSPNPSVPRSIIRYVTASRAIKS